MSDTIGICECINSSDKRKMDQVFTQDIDELDDRIAKINNSRKELIEFGANPNALIEKHESRKSELKNLLQKIRNTPDCK